MITTYFIFYFLIHSINSNPIVRDGNDICQINGYFVPSNGYGWIERNNQIICTCPDFRYEINQPCRICNRLGICGPQDALCSEEQSNFISINNTSHITCFCSSGLFIIGDKCPQQHTTIGPLTTTTTTTIQQTNTISTTTTLTTTTPTTTTTTATTTIPVTPSPPPPPPTTITTTIKTSTAEITTISMSTTVSTEAPMSSPMSSTTPREQPTPTTMKDTTKTTNTTASPCDVRSSSSYLFVKPLLIILLNLVYFVNK